MNLKLFSVVLISMKRLLIFLAIPSVAVVAAVSETNVNDNVADLGTIVIEASHLSKYRPTKVSGGSFTDMPPEKLPCVVDTITEDFIRERNPTDLNDLLRWIPGIDTGGTSLLVRQPGLFSVRGMGGSEPSFDGVIPIGSGAGLFMDPFLLDRVEVVKGPIGSLQGGAGAQRDNNGAGGSINLHLKGAYLSEKRTSLQAQTSIGKNTWRQRGMLDHNEVVSEDRIAIRAVGSFDFYDPAYVNQGIQNGASPRQSYTIAPSFIYRPIENLTFGLKSIFMHANNPSYIGIPVWRGNPANGYSWYESSCKDGQRSEYRGFMINPYADWQVNDEWLLKFGAAMMYSWRDHRTIFEPNSKYWSANGGYVPTDDKYMTSQFSEGKKKQISRSYNVYTRSIWTKEDLPYGLSNSFVIQPDYYYRETYGRLGVNRFGVTFQDAVGWKWISLLGSVRYDYFREQAGDGYSATVAQAVSPRGGLTVQPLEWLVFFGNLSQTRTPTLGLTGVDSKRPDEPWYATQYEAGFRVSPVDNLWLSLSAYRIEQENTPVADPINPDLYHFEGESRSEGIEFSLTGDITEYWTMMAMYAYNEYTDLTKPKSDPGRDFERRPKHTFTINTSYRFGEGILEDIVIGGSYRLRTKSYATVRGEFRDQNLYFNPSHVFDINMSIPFSKFGGSENWVLTFGVRNIFGEKYFDTSRHYYECFVGECRMFDIGIRASF